MTKVINEKSIAYTPKWSIRKVIEEASKYDSVLDVGCGSGSMINAIRAERRYGIDICQAAIDRATIRNNGVRFIVGNLSNIENISPIVECVTGIDIVEHFDKEQAIQFVEKCEGRATKKVIFFVPVGNHPQTHDDRGFGNDYYQTHRSSWYPKDFEELGYDVYFYPDWHKNPEKDKGAMFCIKTLV